MPEVAENRDDLELDDLNPEGLEGLDENLDVDDAEPAEVVAEKERASRMGWCPKDDFKGDPERWVEHDEFLRRGEERMPVLKERLRKQDRTIETLQKDIDGIRKSQGRRDRLMYDEAMGDFEKRQREAVEEADTDAFDQATKERQEYEAGNLAEAPAPVEQAVDPGFESWRERNSWYGGEKNGTQAMTRYANAMGGFVKENRPELVGTPEFYDEVETLVRTQYPNYFENPARKRAGAVESARGARGAAGGKHTYADLPPAAKRKCAEYIENGYVADKAEYVASYFE